MSGELLAVGGGASPVGYYIAALLTVVTMAGGYGFKKLIDRLSGLGTSQGKTASDVAVLVERVAPVAQQLTSHETAIGELRQGHGTLTGEVSVLRELVQRALGAGRN